MIQHRNILKSSMTQLKHFILQQVLSKNIFDILKTANVKAHITPISHKKDTPGRPVVSSIDCHTSKLSKFVDHYLQHHAKALPSYVKATTDFINKIENVKDSSEDSTLVTLSTL